MVLLALEVPEVPLNQPYLVDPIVQEDRDDLIVLGDLRDLAFLVAQ